MILIIKYAKVEEIGFGWLDCRIEYGGCGIIGLSGIMCSNPIRRKFNSAMQQLYSGDNHFKEPILNPIVNLPKIHKTRKQAAFAFMRSVLDENNQPVNFQSIFNYYF